MQSICQTLGASGNEILNLWLEFEEQKTERAQIAKQLDKLQAIMKAITYEKRGEPVIAQEFIDSNGPKIKHPKLIIVLKEQIARL